jgi:transcription-repair coupling factor (superfamily II helicase)
MINKICQLNIPAEIIAGIKVLVDMIINDFFQNIEENLEKDRIISLEGSNNETGKILTILNLVKKYQKILWICGEAKEAQKIFTNLERIKSKVYQYELTDQNDENDFLKLITRQQILTKLLSKDQQIIVTDSHSLFQKIASKKDLIRYQIKLGDRYSQNKLIKNLIDSGYKREDRVILEGDISIRGEIIDIFSLQHKFPVRIEFFGDQIDKIYSFDQLSGDKIKDFETFAISTIKIDKSCEIILDYFEKKDLIIFDQPDRIANILQNLNIIDPDILKFSQLQSKLSKNKIIYFQPLFGFSIGINQKKIDYFLPGQYNGNIRKFIYDLKNYFKENFKIYFASEDPLRIEEILKGYDIKYSFLPYQLPEGLLSKKNKIVIFTDRDIFGKKIVFKALTPTKKQKVFLESFSPGDYLVHLDHGIGRFLQTEKLSFSENYKPILYVIIEYFYGDRLYLPASSINKISKYIGVAGVKVQLSKLGSVNWLRTRKRIEESTYKIAKELLQVSALRKVKRGFIFRPKFDWEKILIDSFEYRETDDQAETINAVYQDMESTKPMDRLICGDVGFGKTEVAIRAATRVVANEKQVAFVCPTTILTEQHLVTFRKRLAGLPIRIESISRFKSKKDQRTIVDDLKTGKIDILIGTHRLLQNDIYFKDLGLTIIDEEQRFGVKHKEKLKKLRAEVDILTLSATPIPRTLYSALGGIKEISKIQTPPLGRLPIETKIIQYDDRQIKSAILDEIKRRGQIYFIHNSVETIYSRANQLREILPKNIKIGIVHGQMKVKDLASTMADFTSKKYDILLATTIVENGLDLSNVNTLIVERADKFGLSELYQLRGRVGRGDKKAYAYFTVPSQILTEDARKRLMVLLESKDLGSGFMVAERDLEIRGGGNVLGKEQSGHIAEVGLSLYSELLKQAVEKLKS